MRLHIHPSSLWIAYGIRRPSEVQARLPANLRLASVPLYANDKRPSPKLLFNAYDVTSEPRYMHGHRIDVQTIAYDTRRHTVHLVVLDCITDAAHWDPSAGIRMFGNARCSRPARGGGAAVEARAAAAVQQRCRLGRPVLCVSRGGAGVRRCIPRRRGGLGGRRRGLMSSLAH